MRSPGKSISGWHGGGLATAVAGLGVTLAGIFAGGMETAALSYGISAATEVLKWFTAVCLV